LLESKVAGKFERQHEKDATLSTEAKLGKNSLPSPSSQDILSRDRRDASFGVVACPLGVLPGELVGETGTSNQAHPFARPGAPAQNPFHLASVNFRS
jgi:hypothetical protein